MHITYDFHKKKISKGCVQHKVKMDILQCIFLVKNDLESIIYVFIFLIHKHVLCIHYFQINTFAYTL